ncbi:MAG: efflux RND transporter periplasmic adaptor subunit [Puniceicoccales bacterium]|jgi:multidrug efflux system membrane fusion protein|nr:efflux RND transporter periplasmic adaptor subunit [Puniceicoccales bacterium]
MKKTSRARLLTFLLLAAATGAGGVCLYRNHARKAAPPRTPPAPVVVRVTKVQTKDVPVWLSGIGNVQAYNTVTIRPRVSGTLDTVNFTEGQLVTRGDVLAQIDPRPYQAALTQARARKKQNEAQLANAQRELDRIRGLVRTGAESQRILDQQQTLIAQLGADLQGNQAVIDAAQLDLDFTTIRTPITGRAGIRQIDEGNIVTANQGEGLVIITQIQPITVHFSLSQRHIAQLRPRLQPGAPRPVVQAIGENNEVLGTGELDLMDNQVDNATGTFRLKARFANEDEALYPGQYIKDVRVLLDTRKDVQVIPAATVTSGINGPIVYVAKTDNTVEVRPVTPVRVTNEQIVIIEKGLAAGETVVVEGQHKLKPGAAINPLTEQA